MYNNALKKIADAGGKYDKATNTAQASSGNSKGAKKTKTSNKADLEGDDEERNMPRRKTTATESETKAGKDFGGKSMNEILGIKDATSVKVEDEVSPEEESSMPRSTLKRKGKSRQESSPAKRGRLFRTLYLSLI